jgi:hypothetical protein
MGLHVNFRTWLGWKAELIGRHFDRQTRTLGPFGEEQANDAGTEVMLYSGLTVRGKPALWATPFAFAIVVVAFLATMDSVN